MGAWGTEPFANDGALDFGAEMASHATTADELSEFLSVALLKAEEPGYLEADDGQDLVAAAGMVAWLTGLEPDLAPAVVRPLIDAARAADFRSLAPGALKALERVQDPVSSELFELWGESGELGEWEEHAERLAEHLRQVAARSGSALA